MKKIYRGWTVALTCTLLLAFAVAPGLNLSGIFIKPISEDFGISRTTVSLITTIYTIAGMAGSLMVGKVLKKVNIRLSMCVSIVALSLTYIARSFSQNIMPLYIFSAIAGLFVMQVAMVPTSLLVSNWFGSRMRGRVMGLVMAGTGLGSMILNPIIGMINANIGWRSSYLLIGIIQLAILLPLILITIKEKPEDVGLKRIGDDDMVAQQRVRGFKLKNAIKTKSFWLICGSALLFGMNGSSFMSNTLPFFSDIGFTAIEAAILGSATSAILIIGKISLGIICDKVGVKRASISFASLQILGMASLIFAMLVNRAFVFPAILFFGLGTSVATVCNPLITQEILGNRDYGSIYGIVTVFDTIGFGLGAMIGNIIFDSTGTYLYSWILGTILTTTLVIVMISEYKLRPQLDT